jgi:predicted lysophospholipase L1 biosynthesis ABC-type transport system permease subunit
LGPLSAEHAAVSVGDTIELTGPRGAEKMTITGLAFVPAGPHNDYASGGWVLPGAFDRLFDGFRFHFGLVSTTSNADAQFVADRLAEQHQIMLGRGPIQPPEERGELADLRTLPLFLAAFLSVLAIAAVGHTLASTARRRRRDIAMLRALGMRPRASGAIVFVQAGAIACVGLLLGLPLGVVIGRNVWRTVALDTPVQFVGPARWPTGLAVALAVAAIAALLAIRPSKRLVSMQIAAELHSE